MANPIASGARLMAAGWVLIRHDALAPRELDPYLPPAARWLAGFLFTDDEVEALRCR